MAGCTGVTIPTYTLDALDRGERNPAVLSGSYGRQLGEEEAQKLDNHLATAMKMKREVEITGRSIKQSYATNPQVLSLAQHKYDLATSSLDTLRMRVRGDIVNKSTQPSAETLQASDEFQQRGNDLIAYHGELSGERSGAVLTVALHFLGEVYRAWSGFQGEKQAAVLNGVDQRLSAVGWQAL